MLEQIVTAGGAVKSYEMASILLKKLAEVEVSPRHLNNLTCMVGEELATQTEQRTEAYRNAPLPRQPNQPETPIELAMVACDGGRMQTRLAEAGPGVHDAHWRETKNAGFFRMKTQSHGIDPHPQLPRCFASREHMSHLLTGVPEEMDFNQPVPASDPTPDWRPQSLFRTCLSSLSDSESFGLMMAAEADARGMFAAQRQAYLGDGQAYNWTIQRRHFPTFEPIVDFIHPLEYLYEASRAIHLQEDAAWDIFQAWAEKTWQGGVDAIVTELRETLAELPEQEQERRDAVTTSLTYLENNRTRMDYPRYRREGLPVSSALIESLIKEINYRVKGTEKFWNDNDRGAAILHVRAALLSHGDRLAKYLCQRPGSPYARTRKPPASTAV